GLADHRSTWLANCTYSMRPLISVQDFCQQAEIKTDFGRLLICKANFNIESSALSTMEFVHHSTHIPLSSFMFSSFGRKRMASFCSRHRRLPTRSPVHVRLTEDPTGQSLKGNFHYAITHQVTSRNDPLFDVTRMVFLAGLNCTSHVGHFLREALAAACNSEPLPSLLMLVTFRERPSLLLATLRSSLLPTTPSANSSPGYPLQAPAIASHVGHFLREALTAAHNSEFEFFA
ncbi:MAG: hypothetical protein NXY57DRAFT_1083790, partial [Lentinula lateritia]